MIGCFIKHPNISGVLINLANIKTINKVGVSEIKLVDCNNSNHIFDFDTQEERDLYYRTLEQYLILDIGL